jgi:fucose permease
MFVALGTATRHRARRMNTANLRSRRCVVLLLTFLAFVPLGLPDGLIGVAWPSIRVHFGVPIDALGWLFVTSTVGYVGSSLMSGALLRRLRVGGLVAASCLASAASLVGYAYSPSFVAMATLGLVAGASAGAIDAGINTFAAVSYSARTLNFLHAFYGLGTATGPILMTATLAAGMRWQAGYLFVAFGVALLACVFAAARRLWPVVAEVDESGGAASLAATLGLPAAQLSMAVFFLYVGLEAAAGVWLYSLLHEARNVPMVVAGTAVSAYWLALFGGRVLYAFVPPHVSPRAVITPCICGAAAGAALLAWGGGSGSSVAAAVIIGLCSGPIFPSMIATTPSRLGPAHTSNAVGAQIAISGIGLALVPALAGALADTAGLRALPVALVACWCAQLALYLMLDRPSRALTADAASARPDAATAAVRRN